MLSPADPCTKIDSHMFIPPVDALACYKTFPFNETLHQNVLTNIAHVYYFYIFKDFYLNLPPPLKKPTSIIRATLTTINEIPGLTLSFYRKSPSY